MKKLYILAFINLLCITAPAQGSKENIMEKRARELHRVLGLDNPDEWMKFIQENYTQALIDKPMHAIVEGTESKGTSASTQTEKIEGKTPMFQMLHNDLGESKILSLKSSGESLEMVVRNSSTGFTATFKLRFEQEKPYRIDGLGVEAGEVQR